MSAISSSNEEESKAPDGAGEIHAFSKCLLLDKRVYFQTY